MLFCFPRSIFRTSTFPCPQVRRSRLSTSVSPPNVLPHHCFCQAHLRHGGPRPSYLLSLLPDSPTRPRKSGLLRTVTRKPLASNNTYVWRRVAEICIRSLQSWLRQSSLHDRPSRERHSLKCRAVLRQDAHDCHRGQQPALRPD